MWPLIYFFPRKNIFNIKNFFFLSQVNEAGVGSSNKMELEGLDRIMKRLVEDDLEIECIVTDGHTSMPKYFRENHPTILHFLDVWHVAKSINLIKRFACVILYFTTYFISCIFYKLYTKMKSINFITDLRSRLNKLGKTKTCKRVQR